MHIFYSKSAKPLSAGFRTGHRWGSYDAYPQPLIGFSLATLIRAHCVLSVYALRTNGSAVQCAPP